MIKDVMKTTNASDAITEILIIVLSILISTLILRLLWNNSLVKHVTVLRPLNTFIDALLLSISLAVIRGI
ncbi:hypothetical protein [Dishui Lake phycodnavirus 4]|nr:hypothetical protein [Dishui Lake phycodnavirus 4]